jgi:branched-chain amino acid transport system permease protein
VRQDKRDVRMIEKRLSVRGGRKLTKLATYAGVIVFLCLVPLFIKSPYYLHIFILAFIYIIASASLRTITISGQFPLAHAAFMGVGGYTSAVVAKELGWSLFLTIPLGALMAMGIGILIGYPFARLRALYYALGSLFFGIGMVQVFLVFNRWTCAYQGLTGMPPLFSTVSKVPYYYFFLGLTLLCLLALYRFEFCRIGTTLKAIAQSYLVASSVGINEAWYRVFAVGIGCFFVGLAGATYAHYNLALSYTSFDMLATLWIVLYVLIGGIDSFAGPIIGTAVLVLLPEFARELKAFVPYISAGMLLIVVFVMPQGLVSLPRLVRSWYSERKKGGGVAHVSGN